jgi:hypothetical protein
MLQSRKRPQIISILTANQLQEDITDNSMEITSSNFFRNIDAVTMNENQIFEPKRHCSRSPETRNTISILSPFGVDNIHICQSSSTERGNVMSSSLTRGVDKDIVSDLNLSFDPAYAKQIYLFKKSHDLILL